MGDNFKCIFDEIIDKFTFWAQISDDVKSALIIGSRARIDRPADEYSDLDLIMVVTNPDYYLSSNQWLENIGAYWISFTEDTNTSSPPIQAQSGLHRLLLYHRKWSQKGPGLQYIFRDKTNICKLHWHKLSPIYKLLDFLHIGIRIQLIDSRPDNNFRFLRTDGGSLINHLQRPEFLHGAKHG